MTRWYFGLDPKAIQDGHYPDFFRGQQAEFPVEASSASWKAAELSVPSAQRVDGCQYDVVALVVAVEPAGWVLDCGILVHGVGPLPDPAVGSWLTGRARLRVSVAAPSHPGLKRPWYVERVFHRVEPIAEATDPRLLMVDVEELGWEELAFTDSWHDDEGQADYLLECVAVGTL